MLPVPVAAALIRLGPQILIAQRKPDAYLGLLWEFPAGKVEFGERPEDALVREIGEELGLAIRVDSLFSVESHVYGTGADRKHVLLLVYNCSPLGEPALLDAHAYAWSTPAEMRGYAFAPADWAVVAKLGGGALNGPEGEIGKPAES